VLGVVNDLRFASSARDGACAQLTVWLLWNGRRDIANNAKIDKIDDLGNMSLFAQIVIYRNDLGALSDE
jgi:hypothetical protein